MKMYGDTMSENLEIIECEKMEGATHSKATCLARIKRLAAFDRKTGRGGRNAWNFSGAEWTDSPYEICRDCEFGRMLAEDAGIKLPYKKG